MPCFIGAKASPLRACARRRFFQPDPPLCGRPHMPLPLRPLREGRLNVATAASFEFGARQGLVGPGICIGGKTLTGMDPARTPSRAPATRSCFPESSHVDAEAELAVVIGRHRACLIASHGNGRLQCPCRGSWSCARGFGQAHLMHSQFTPTVRGGLVGCTRRTHQLLLSPCSGRPGTVSATTLVLLVAHRSHAR